MTFDEAWVCTDRIEGWLHREEGAALWRGCEAAVPVDGSMVEIGAYRGRSTSLLAQFAAGRASLTVVEPFWYAPGVRDGDVPNQNRYLDRVYQDETYRTFAVNMKEFFYTVVLEPTIDLLPTDLPASIDFAFIDGDHTLAGVLVDCFTVLPRVRVGGIVAFHDYRPDVYDVKRVVDWCCRPSEWVLVEQAMELRVLRRIS